VLLGYAKVKTENWKRPPVKPEQGRVTPATIRREIEAGRFREN
jgi:hypothetical protein